MIIDTIENLGNYVALNPLFADVIEFLKNNDLRTMKEGKYPMKDNNPFLSVQIAKQSTQESAFFETQIQRADNQIHLPCPQTCG